MMLLTLVCSSLRCLVSSLMSSSRDSIWERRSTFKPEEVEERGGRQREREGEGGTGWSEGGKRETGREEERRRRGGREGKKGEWEKKRRMEGGGGGNEKRRQRQFKIFHCRITSTAHNSSNEVERCTFQVLQVVDLVLQVCHQLISLLRHLTQLALHLHTIQETPISLPSEVHTGHVPQCKTGKQVLNTIIGRK